MRHQCRFEPITVEQFLRIDTGDDRKYELDHGALRLLAGAVAAHGRIAGNLLAWLGQRLRGSGFQVRGSGFALRTGDLCCRMPDVCVYADSDRDPAHDADQLAGNPTVVVELRALGTTPGETDARVAEYRALRSMDTIVLIDPLTSAMRVAQRLGATSWRDDLFSEAHDLHLPALDLTIPHVEIFARD